MKPHTRTRVTAALTITGIFLMLLFPTPVLATQKCNYWFYNGYACQRIDDPYYNAWQNFKFVDNLHTSRAVNSWTICDYDSYFWLEEPNHYDTFWHWPKHYGCSGSRAYFSNYGVDEWVEVNSYGRGRWKDNHTDNLFRHITTQRIY